MTNAEIPIGRQAARAWKRLGRGVRKDVWRRARQGLGHPDPAVAAIAIGRARYTLSRGFAVRYAGRMFLLLIGTLGAAALVNRLTSPTDARAPGGRVEAVQPSELQGIVCACHRNGRSSVTCFARVR